MNANYINAQVFYPSNPVGIDLKIKDMQTAFAAGLPWLEKVFGRCTTQRNTIVPPASEKPKEVVYPEVYQANNEPMNAMPNDNFKSYCFFNVTDPGVFLEYEPFDTQQLLRRPVSIIFWCNLAKINPDQTGRFNENLIIDVLKVLQSIPDFAASKTFERYDHVFQEFTITEQYRNFMKLPFTAFRIDGELTYAAFPENVCI